jgi:hypothetical protein
MKYVFEMGSGAMMYVHTEFNNDWFRLSEVKERGGIHRHTDSLVTSRADAYF